jgi:hypothetical protein
MTPEHAAAEMTRIAQACRSSLKAITLIEALAKYMGATQQDDPQIRVTAIEALEEAIGHLAPKERASTTQGGDSC